MKLTEYWQKEKKETLKPDHENNEKVKSDLINEKLKYELIKESQKK